jgi:hypothetical protein
MNVSATRVVVTVVPTFAAENDGDGAADWQRA